MIFINVDFPPPDSPRMDTNSPRSNCKLIPLRTGMIAVTHDLRLREYADNVYELADGKLKLSKNSPDQ